MLGASHRPDAICRQRLPNSLYGRAFDPKLSPYRSIKISKYMLVGKAHIAPDFSAMCDYPHRRLKSRISARFRITTLVIVDVIARL